MVTSSRPFQLHIPLASEILPHSALASGPYFFQNSVTLTVQPVPRVEDVDTHRQRPIAGVLPLGHEHALEKGLEAQLAVVPSGGRMQRRVVAVLNVVTHVIAPVPKRLVVIQIVDHVFGPLMVFRGVLSPDVLAPLGVPHCVLVVRVLDVVSVHDGLAGVVDKLLQGCERLVLDEEESGGSAGAVVFFEFVFVAFWGRGALGCAFVEEVLPSGLAFLAVAEEGGLLEYERVEESLSV